MVNERWHSADFSVCEMWCVVCVYYTFIHVEFVGSKRPFNVTVSSACGDNEPVILITGIFNVFDTCGVPDGVRAIFKSVRCIYALINIAKFVGFTDRSKCDLYICRNVGIENGKQ